MSGVGLTRIDGVLCMRSRKMYSMARPWERGVACFVEAPERGRASGHAVDELAPHDLWTFWVFIHGGYIYNQPLWRLFWNGTLPVTISWETFLTN
jgi:hypothetical protein